MRWTVEELDLTSGESLMLLSQFGMHRCDLLYSPGLLLVCSLMQNFTIVLNLIKEAFFKHGDENILKTCIQVLSFAANESEGDLRDSANQVIKEIADDLLVKLRSAISEARVISLEFVSIYSLVSLHSPIYIAEYFEIENITLDLQSAILGE